MPEGHSVHRLARQFDDVFGGQVLAVSSPQGRFAPAAKLINGQQLISAQAHGKQLFLGFGNELVLRVHLGLYGAWSFGGDGHFSGASSIGAPRRVGESEQAGTAESGAYAGPPEPVGQVRARLVSEHGWADLRGPTACEVLTEDQAATARAKLGPDPLLGAAGEFNLAKGRGSLERIASDAAEAKREFVARLGRKKTPIGTALMDQALLAGVGNIYRAEALFRGRIDPFMTCRDLSTLRAAALWEDIVEIMNDGVREGKIITTRVEDRSDVGPLWPDNAYYTYQRQHQQCRCCDARIALMEVAGRKLYWCPGCQRKARKRISR
ncbi:Fpg/Nei family DNA glycosylase [Paeniglutamicibacter cryotolerans]|uniref:DNA-(apurinic or apyrimidinic site) lyase n=1 Tax=Paeniglutamicibacter cryotolerans TaxID=670079 RepID=A0A839QM37_9MICC|nr:DNA glycosylase [Paeniglutamicibacter cryotolerans]MBB2996927.1 endonuclease-8 [Paeniglutamicibacter cryotolerans]